MFSGKHALIKQRVCRRVCIQMDDTGPAPVSSLQVFAATQFLFIMPAPSHMATCCICKGQANSLKITDGNPKYKGKPVCKECQGYRKLLLDTK